MNTAKRAEITSEGWSIVTIESNMPEIRRLISSFEAQAQKFHDIQFHTFHVTQDGPSIRRRFASPHHAIMLWQYYGIVGDEKSIDRFTTNVSESDLQWGLRGSELSFFGLIEGNECQLFVRMAQRAGALFNKAEALEIRSRVISEIIAREMERNHNGKPTAAINNNSLAVWLNYLLYHVSLTNPERSWASRIDPDPFSLSLLALERLANEKTIGKSDRSARKLSEINFKVAVTFPGEKRAYVSRVVDSLRGQLGKDEVFYDFDYQAQLARPNVDTLLQDIYRNKSELIVVFLCSAYAEKQWCHLEWRAVRDIIKSKQDKRIMFVRFDDADVQGVFSIDGYIDANVFSPDQVATFVLSRLDEL